MKVKTWALHIVKHCGPHVTCGSRLTGLLYRGNEDYRPTNYFLAISECTKSITTGPTQGYAGTLTAVAGLTRISYSQQFRSQLYRICL
jgi:hypothetical protein